MPQHSEDSLLLGLLGEVQKLAGGPTETYRNHPSTLEQGIKGSGYAGKARDTPARRNGFLS